MAQRNRDSLSKNLLQMKFMKRSKEKAELEIEEEKSKILIEEQLSETIKKGDRFYVEPSHVLCEGLVFGRLSFRGKNPEIEKLMQEKKDNKTINKRMHNECEVSNTEMAKIYDTLQPSRKKRKYITREKDDN